MKQVCGLDVHKDSIFLCIVNEHSEVVHQEKFGVLTPDLERMVGVMHSYDVSEACMESTSIYWIPIWRFLEPYFELTLVNPYFIKQLPGKKSDVKDSEWIATCLMKGLVSKSYVPDELIQQLRQYDRRIFDLNAEIVRKLGKLDAALQRCNIRISNYVSTTDSKSYREVVRLISEGTTDPAILAKVIHGRTVNRAGHDVIVASLTGIITECDIDIINQLREELLLADKHYNECQDKMESICEKHFKEELTNLQTIPGISKRSAASVLAEVGNDVSSFQDAGHLVSWAGLKPRNEESAGKIKSRRIVHGNKFLRKTLIECSWAAGRKVGSYFNKFSYCQVVVRRKNKMKVQVAIARKLLTAIWFVLHDHVAYRDYTPDIEPAA